MTHCTQNKVLLESRTSVDILSLCKRTLLFVHKEQREMEERKLYDAASTGDVTVLLELLEKDPSLLDRVSYTSTNNTPLHVAAMKNHLSLVEAILNRNPRLAEELNSQQSTALHIASGQGSLEIAKRLVEAAPDMCLSRDCQGRNPLHLAAMKGHVEVLKELVRTAPLAARAKVDRAHTVLHLCVEYGQLEAFKILVQELSDLVNVKDDDGDTLLHLAVMGKQVEILKYLVESTKINVSAKNSNGQTAASLLQHTPQNTTNSEIINILCHKPSKPNKKDPPPVKWLTKKRDSIMVVAILIATMAFTIGVSPPGGVWQQDEPADSNGVQRRAGEAVMAHSHPRAYRSFMKSNTICFVSALSTILLLISGLPFRRRLFMWFLMVIMWLTITSVAVTYAIAITVVTPKKDRKTLTHVIEIGVIVWMSVMVILLVGNTLRLIDKWLKKKGVVVWRPKRFRHFEGGDV